MQILVQLKSLQITSSCSTSGFRRVTRVIYSVKNR